MVAAADDRARFSLLPDELAFPTVHRARISATTGVDGRREGSAPPLGSLQQ